MDKLEKLTSPNFRWRKGMIYLVVALILVGWLLNTPTGLLGKSDAVGYAVCHRIEVHSFSMGDRAMPLCARCSGMYLGAFLGIIYLAVFSRRKAGFPTKGILFILVFFVIVFTVDGINSFLFAIPFLPGFYVPQNWLRLLSGSGMGIVIALFVFPAFNQTVWNDWDRSPVINGFRHFILLMFCVFILDLILLSGVNWLLFPLSLISAAGVIVVLTMIYTMIFAMIFKLENRFMFFQQMFFLLCAGFGLAIIQIIVLDTLRFVLTGTWDGFHLG